MLKEQLKEAESYTKLAFRAGEEEELKMVIGTTEVAKGLGVSVMRDWAAKQYNKCVVVNNKGHVNVPSFIFLRIWIPMLYYIKVNESKDYLPL